MSGEDIIHKLFDPSIWETGWNLNTRERSVKESAAIWDKKAVNLNRNVLNDKGKKRSKEILEWIEHQGVTIEGKTILDIGSGPGVFTIPMAQKAKQVTAIEPSKVMATFLYDNLQKENISNVEVMEKGWQEIDTSNWEGMFDLVFVSLSPGVYNWETFQKALACSNKYMYFSSFAGKREHHAIKELWPILTAKNPRNFDLHVNFLINLLYLNGYSYDLKLWDETSSRQLTYEEAVSEILQLLNQDGLTLQQKDEELVKSYVIRSLENDYFSFKTTSRFGRVLIHK